MKQKIKMAFMKKLRTDDDFARQLISCKDKDERLKFVKEAGFDVTPEELSSLKEELTDEELEMIAGGKPPTRCECFQDGGKPRW